MLEQEGHGLHGLVRPVADDDIVEVRRDGHPVLWSHAIGGCIVDSLPIISRSDPSPEMT
jgi:hypothetical protein